MSESRKICVGQILGAHGVKGQAKLASFTDNVEDVGNYGPLTDEKGKRSFTVKLGVWNKSHFICTISGLSTREEVEAMKGTKLYVERSKLPKVGAGEYYYADLIGLEARLASGAVYGKVLDMKNYGAGDIIEIAKAAGGTELLPFNKEVVPEVQVDKGYLIIDPPILVDLEEH